MADAVPPRFMEVGDSMKERRYQVSELVAASRHDRAGIRRRLGMKLGKLAWSIERVTVRARDGNGPRGGVDQECTVKVY